MDQVNLPGSILLLGLDTYSPAGSAGECLHLTSEKWLFFY